MCLWSYNWERCRFSLIAVDLLVKYAHFFVCGSFSLSSFLSFVFGVSCNGLYYSPPLCGATISQQRPLLLIYKRPAGIHLKSTVVDLVVPVLISKFLFCYSYANHLLVFIHLSAYSSLSDAGNQTSNIFITNFSGFFFWEILVLFMTFRETKNNVH